MQSSSDDEGAECKQPWKQVLHDEHRVVTLLKYDPDSRCRIEEAKVAIKESDVTVLCESHVCPQVVSQQLNATLTSFVEDGGWFLHTSSIECSGLLHRFMSKGIRCKFRGLSLDLTTINQRLDFIRMHVVMVAFV